jgi:hypothetical protein
MEAKIFRTKVGLFISDPWNLTEMIAIGLYIIGVALRFISDSYECYMAARSVLILFATFYIHINEFNPFKIVLKNILMHRSDSVVSQSAACLRKHKKNGSLAHNDEKDDS